MNTRTRGIVVYLLIAFGLAWGSWEIALRFTSVLTHPEYMKAAIAPGAFAPAIAAFVVRRWVTREGFTDVGLRLHLRKWPYYLVAWLLPLAVLGSIVALAPIFGIGHADFSLARGFKYMAALGAPLPAYVPRQLGMLTVVLLIQTPFAAPILFGEEFGWRGYLQPRLFPQSPVLSAVVTGTIWAYWHLPLNLRGGNFPENPKLGALVIFPVGAIFLSIIFGWLVQKTGSIWSSSLAHAATNGIGGSLFIALFGGGANFLFVSYGGILGWIPLGALSAWIVFTRQLKPAVSLPGQPKSALSVQAGA